MNIKVILPFLLLVILSCLFKTDKPIPEKRLEGWAGNPDNPNEKPFDYFYMRSTATASKKSINKNNDEMMKATCIDAVSTNLERKFIEFILEDNLHLFFCKSFQEKDSSNYAQQEMAYYANSFNNLHLINASDGNCIPRKSFIVDYSERKKLEIKIEECQPLYLDDSEIPISGWKECECVAYTYIKGGRDAVIARAMEINKE